MDIYQVLNKIIVNSTEKKPHMDNKIVESRNKLKQE